MKQTSSSAQATCLVVIYFDEKGRVKSCGLGRIVYLLSSVTLCYTQTFDMDIPRYLDTGHCIEKDG